MDKYKSGDAPVCPHYSHQPSNTDPVPHRSLPNMNPKKKKEKRKRRLGTPHAPKVVDGGEQLTYR